MVPQKFHLFLLKFFTLLQIAAAFAILGIFVGTCLNDLLLPKWWVSMDVRFAIFLLIGFPLILSGITFFLGGYPKSKNFAFWTLMFAFFWIGRFVLLFLASYALGKFLIALPYYPYLELILILICFAGRTYEPLLPKEEKKLQTE